MSSDDPNRTPPAPPPAAGVRLQWQQVPQSVRTPVEEALGCPVVRADSQPTGFSPGVAARMKLADGRRVFVKAVGPEPNPDSADLHRREAKVMPALPVDAPIPSLLYAYDEGGWVVLVLEDIEGALPRQPWDTGELDRVLNALTALTEMLTPSPLPPQMVGTAAEDIAPGLRGWDRLAVETPSLLDGLEPWSLRHLDALIALQDEAAAAVEGETLLHLDVRADNILLTPERVWFVDWPWASVGAPWVDIVFFAPSVTMQGGPPPEEVVARHPAYKAADPAAVTAVIALLAGFFTHRSLRPPPPGLPTLRAFQAALGIVTRQWVADRTGWT